MATEGLSGERTPGVRRDRVCPLVAPLPFHSRSAGQVAAAAQGVGGGSSPVWVSSPAWAASARGLGDQRQAGLSSGQRGSLEHPPKTPRRRRSTRYRSGRPAIERPNDCWAMDCMADSLYDGRAFRILTRVDGHSRESLATVPRPSFRAQQVGEILNGLMQTRGKPHAIRCDTGPEFAGWVLDQWAYGNNIELDLSRPGKPTDHAYIEAFNARLRAECLNASWFLSMHDARDRIESWRQDYNTARPHSALGNLTPRAFARQAHEARKIA